MCRQTDKQTDMTKPVVPFHDFAIAPNARKTELSL